MFESLKRKSKAEVIVFIAVFIIFAIYAASLLYIPIFTVLNSLKTPTQYYDDSFGLPTQWQFINYARALEELTVEGSGFWEMTLNSFWWAFGHVFFNLVPIILFSYVIMRFRFPGREFLLILNYISIIVTVYGSQSADYVYFAELGVLNTPWLVVCAIGGFGTTTLIVMSFMESLSWGYAEAAEIDGANEFTIFLQIYVPLIFPIIATLALTKFIGTWNDYYGPLLYMEDYPTLASGLYEYRLYSVERKGNYPIYFAGMLITLAPVLVLYTAFSDVIMKNMGIGGLKG